MARNPNNPTTWVPSGYKGKFGFNPGKWRMPRISLPSVDLGHINFPSVSFTRLIICITALSITVAISYALVLFGKIVEARVDRERTIEMNINERLIPIYAKIDWVNNEVEWLKAHATIVYHEYRPRKYEVRSPKGRYYEYR